MDKHNLRKLEHPEVCHLVGISYHLLYGWYKWYRNPEYDKPADMPPLPPYSRHRSELTGKQVRYWYNDDIDKLIIFKEWMKAHGRGAMAAYNKDMHWKHNYTKIIKNPELRNQYREKRVEKMHNVFQKNARLVNDNELKNRALRAASFKYAKPKWIEFCEEFMENGYVLYLYEAKTTYSKYLYVTKGKKCYKVRFSNHKPNYKKEQEKDCDFFVGVTHFSVTTTTQAIRAVYEFFGDKLNSIRYEDKIKGEKHGKETI